ncbi:MAG: hypothetical protein JSS02_00855 [Planctomycetes bacterium]|nr:hypothetical protein [Planctomycetota bacterium]
MANPSADTPHAEPRRFSIRLPRPAWIGAAVAVLIAAGGGFVAIAEQRHRIALAHLVADGAVVGSPRYGSGITIYLAGQQFTDGHFRHLRDLRGIRELRIMDVPRITDAGFATLGRRTDIELLSLIRTGVSPESLPQIGRWTDLTWLAIPGMRVQGADLIHLKNLTNLKLLHLDETPLADADLRALPKLSNLLWLSLKDTQTTDAGVADLRKQLAGTRVVR